MKHIYTSNIYKEIKKPAHRAAKALVPMVLDLVPAKSVVDLGCGTGEWLSVFRENGVSTLLGIDGEWVDRKLLRIAPEEFTAHDLTKPLGLGRHFDLAVCLEVVGHIPDRHADTNIESMASMAP